MRGDPASLGPKRRRYRLLTIVGAVVLIVMLAGTGYDRITRDDSPPTEASDVRVGMCLNLAIVAFVDPYLTEVPCDGRQEFTVVSMPPDPGGGDELAEAFCDLGFDDAGIPEDRRRVWATPHEGRLVCLGRNIG